MLSKAIGKITLALKGQDLSKTVSETSVDFFCNLSLFLTALVYLKIATSYFHAYCSMQANFEVKV